MATVVVGAGIVGVSTAFYLAEHCARDGRGQPSPPIHLVETTDRLFASASGYAGGFLARDWFAPEVAALGALSFDQHRALAERFDGRAHWGYSVSTALSYGLPAGDGARGGDAAAPARRRGEDWLRQGTSRSTSAPGAGGDDAGGGTAGTGPAGQSGILSVDEQLPAWLRRQAGDRVDVLAPNGTAGQVEPQAFCAFLLKVCQEHGVQLHQPARVVSVGTDEAGHLSTVRLEMGSAVGQEAHDNMPSSPPSLTQTELPCAHLVITAGAWTPRVVAQLFPRAAPSLRQLPITNYAGHSLQVRTLTKKPSTRISQGTPCHAIFAASPALAYCPEIFGRVDGSLYMAGLNSSTLPLPRLATDAVPDATQLDDLQAACRLVMGGGGQKDDTEDTDDALEIVRAGLCHRPATPWGMPIVQRMQSGQLLGTGEDATSTTPGEGGVFVAAGHGPWGISMGPGTGMVLAELVQGRPLSADVSGLGVRSHEA